MYDSGVTPSAASRLIVSDGSVRSVTILVRSGGTTYAVPCDLALPRAAVTSSWPFLTAASCAAFSRATSSAVPPPSYSSSAMPSRYW